MLFLFVNAGCDSPHDEWVEIELPPVTSTTDNAPNRTRVTEEDDAHALCQSDMRDVKGDGVEKDMTEDVENFRKAAEQGNADAQYWLGDWYSVISLQGDLTEAVKWYLKAAEQGNSFAQQRLGECYAKGEGVKKDMAEAFKWYHRSAEQGYSVAQCDLGKYYLNGEGVEKNMAEAVKWLRKSAEQGWTDAQLELGRCYAKGKGMEKNMPEALKWFRKAAVERYDEVLRLVEECYEKDDGVLERIGESNEKAERRIAHAQSFLGLRYTNTDGVRSIDIKAPSPETLCKISYVETGPFGPTECWTMDFVKSEISYEYSEGKISSRPYCKYVFDKKETEKFIRDCRSFDFSKWINRYVNPLICDGTYWRMILKYSDGRQREIEGKNKWPKTFNLFNTVITNENFKATDKWPTGSDKNKTDIRGGKNNDPRENDLWKKVK